MKIGMLLPEVEMIEKSKNILKNRKVEAVYLKAIHSVDAVDEARLAVEAGAKIVIARGYQAKLIRQYTNIPLVEMRFQAQEIGLLIQKAKRMVKKEHPVIAIVVFKNMLSDVSRLEELLEVTLKIVYLERIEDAPSEIHRLSKENVDIVIGGDVTCDAAEQMGYPTLFYQSTEESIKKAIEEAENMSFAVENEKKNTAQFETVLDTSFNGIIKVNAEGNVIVVNKMVENLLGRRKEELIGLPLYEILPQTNRDLLTPILEGESENYTTSISVRDKAWMLMMAPIRYDEMISGAILSLSKFPDSVVSGGKKQNNMLRNGFSTHTDFRDIYSENPGMKSMLEEARTFALSEHPVLLYGQTGLEDYLVAEAIHNNSTRKGAPYVSINMQGIDKTEQMDELFQRGAVEQDTASGRKGAMVKANHGTLFIKGIEHLTLQVQHQLLRTMVSRSMIRTDSQRIDALDVRIIGSSKVNLKHLVKRGEFNEELYYMLQGLILEIPSLNQRPEDIIYFFDEEMEQCSKRYNKHLKVTEGGYKKLLELPWDGNRIQLSTFCERMVLAAKKRSIDEVLIQKLFWSMYPEVGGEKGEEKILVYQSPEGEALRDLLDKYHGNRNQVAKELGISTTTLWRRMKKYGIEASY